MLIRLLLLLLLASVFATCDVNTSRIKTGQSEKTNWNNEVIYHVMPRSFYDSNGDRHGDLNGFVEKLDYLADLGVTAILFTPLYESGFYHNYFPTDYYKIDPEYGTMQDYLNFIIEVHDRGLKFIMDMETQYVQDGHLWFDTTYSNPGTAYDDFIFYSDSLNTLPAQLFFDTGTPLFDYLAWPGDTSFHIATLDLNQPAVLQWQKEFYAYWTDPNDDGNFYDGVDGFRIDHIMDDLDHKGIWTDLYRNFWTPIFDTCRTINPDLFIVGEQADWSLYGDEIVNKTSADAAFNFPLKFNLRSTEHGHEMASDAADEHTWSIDPNRLHAIMDSCIRKFGPDHYFVNFIENHDTDRFATLVDRDERILKLAAVLLATLPGTPSIYYGQELGLTGKIGDWGSDANHIPIREAFPWQPDVDALGIAAFYKDTGPWWEQSFFRSKEIHDLSLSTQKKDPNSIWHHYRDVLNLRKEHACLRTGNYTPVRQLESNLIAFKRSQEDKIITVIANAQPSTQIYAQGEINSIKSSKILMSSGVDTISGMILMSPYSYAILSSRPE